MLLADQRQELARASTAARGGRPACRRSRRPSSASPRRASSCRSAWPRSRRPRRAAAPTPGWPRRSAPSAAPAPAGAARTTSTRRGILERPDHLAVRDVGHVRLAEERQQVVLAQAEDVDVLDDHHLVVGDGEERAVQQRADVLVGSPGSGSAGPLDSLGRLQQALAVAGPHPALPAWRARAARSACVSLMGCLPGPRPAPDGRAGPRLPAALVADGRDARRLLGHRTGLADRLSPAAPVRSQVRCRCALRSRSKLAVAQASREAAHGRAGHAA